MSSNDDLSTDDSDDGNPLEIEATFIFDSYREKLLAGKDVDPDQLLADHPKHAEYLVPLLVANQLLAPMAQVVVPSLSGYLIVRELGRGGMGIVYEAMQTLSGKQVALKVLPAASAMDPQHLKRFLQVEIPAVKLLNHPNIVPIIEFGCENGINFYVMPYIEGRDLGTVIKDLIHSVDDGTRRNSQNSDNDNFFQQVAKWGQQAAEALDHAHLHGIIHRDIKPSNLILDKHDNIWITDFGLAQIRSNPNSTTSGETPGTPRYMSPEQIMGQHVRGDHRTDIYSLGISLYELMTLQPAFDGKNTLAVIRQVANNEHKRPRLIDPRIPLDLEVIVQKATNKDRDDRYATARDFAEDFHRFLNGNPIVARPLGPVDFAFRWARGHRKAVIAAFSLLVALLVGLSAGLFWIAQAEQRAVTAANQAKDAGDLAREKVRETQYALLMEQVQQLRSASRLSGWSTKAWKLIREASELKRTEQSDYLIEGLAVATLTDLDAYIEQHFKEFGARSLVFDSSGHRLLIGSPHVIKDPRKMLGTKLWNEQTGQIINLSINRSLPSPQEADQQMDIDKNGEGPVAFRPDGTPVQLIADSEAGTLTLWNLESQQPLCEYKIPGRLATQHFTQLGLSADGSLAAASVLLADDVPVYVVWESETGSQLVQFAGLMNCVAFSPDRTLVAVADTTGQIKIASLTMRRVEMRLQSDVTEIQSLAFGRNIHPVDAEIPNKTIADWQLAAGDSGGTVTIWDLDRGIPRTYCRGAYYNIFAVAFSPDGTLLASAGRHLAKIWNATTGQHLLDVVSQDFTYGLAFSSDGRRLALGNRFVSGVQIVSLENGRAVRALRGLSSQVARVIFSGDGRQIAALSQDNKLAIWDLESGLLKHRVDIPQGMYADNAGLAFSPDGLRFAAALGGDNSGAARLWDLVTGKTIKTWPLRPGKQDTLQFHPSGQLLSCRCEYREGRRREFGIVARDNPCLCRLYNLTSETPLEPVAEFDEFDVDINAIVAPQAGSWFLVVGRSGVNGERIVNRVIDGSWVRSPQPGLVSGILFSQSTPLERSSSFRHRTTPTNLQSWNCLRSGRSRFWTANRGVHLPWGRKHGCCPLICPIQIATQYGPPKASI